MAKVITQEAVDKAVAKAVAAEMKRCIAAVRAINIDAGNPLRGGYLSCKKAVLAAILAVKEEE